MRGAALALLVLISSQAVNATHILAGKALVKGLASFLTELPGNNLTQGSGVASVPANFSIGASTGNLFCFPKYYAKEVEVPTLTCPDGYSSNGTNSIGGIACTKQAYVQKQNCFRSMQCPADGQNTVADELCMPGEVRSALIGMLVVFKVKAMLPFTILPILKTALVKAVTFPIILPAKLIGAKVANAGLNQTAGFGGMDLSSLGLGGDFGNKNSSSNLMEMLAQLEMMKPNPAAILAGLVNSSATAGSFGGFGNKNSSSNVQEFLAQLEMMKPNPATMLAGLVNSSATAGSFGSLGDKNSSSNLLELLAQLEALKPTPAAALAGLGALGGASGSFEGLADKVNGSLPLLQLQLPQLQMPHLFNKSAGMGVGESISSFGGPAAAVDNGLGLLLAATQLVSLQKGSANASAGSTGFGDFGGAPNTFGGLSDKEAQIALLITQLAQLQKFNQSSGFAGFNAAAAGGAKDLNMMLGMTGKKQKAGNQSLGVSNMRLAAANSFLGFGDKNSSSSGLGQMLEDLKPDAAAMLASLIGSGSTGGFSGFAEPKGSNASSVVQLLTQLGMLKPNPLTFLAMLTDKNSTMQIIEQLVQMPVINPAGALAALGLGGFGNKNITLPQLLAQIEGLKPNPTAVLADLISSATSGGFGGLGSKNSSSNMLEVLAQLEALKPNPAALLAGLLGNAGASSCGAFGSDKNGTLPLLLQLAALKPNPLAILEVLGSAAAAGIYGITGDKNGTLPMLLQLALQKPNPLAVLEQLQKFNVSLPEFPGLNFSSMTVVPEMSITFGGGNASLPASLVRQAASLTFAGGDVVGALMKGADPLEIFTKCLLNINVNEIMNFVPQINSWVSEHLQNLTHVNEITAQISANFPDCIYRCCKSEQTLETSITLPSLSCSPGLKLNPITKICSGESASYAQCPSNMMKCPASLPSGQPICVSETDSFGLDTCKVLVLAHHTLPQHQCPS